MVFLEVQAFFGGSLDLDQETFSYHLMIREVEKNVWKHSSNPVHPSATQNDPNRSSIVTVGMFNSEVSC